MSRYIIAPEAVQDLDEISNYFLLRNVEVGERWFQAFSQKCQQLEPSSQRLGRDFKNMLHCLSQSIKFI
jgi:toxin ParE1/3/4